MRPEHLVEAATLPMDDGEARPTSALLALDRYQSHKEIARGGMGRVLEAVDLRLSRTVAIKHVLATDPDALVRFARETAITARLEHPAIVPLYDAGTAPDGTPYYVMRKIAGHPLSELVAAKSSLSERLTLVAHVVVAAQAIAHAHARGVVHRDLKPTNILVGDFGETVVIDWGLAKIVGEVEPPVDGAGLPRTGETHAGAVLGTPGYMPVEQLEGAQVDARSDVYALGATLFYVLARQAPHVGTSAEALMQKAANEPARPIAKVEPAVPRDLAVIVDKALAFEAAHRYRDASELAADLRRFLDGQLVAARHYTAGERALRFVRRNLLASISVVLLVAIGGIAAMRVLAAKRETEAALDRAVLEQRATARALARMQLMHARELLATNPTATVALLKPLAISEHWREVRAIAHEAASRGATTTVPGPLQPMELVVEGPHAAAGGIDGSVWLLDLARGSSRQLATLTPRSTHVTFAGATSLIAYDQTRAIAFSVVDGSARELPLARGVQRLSAVPGRAFVIESGELVVVDLASLTVRSLGVEGALEILAAPDGNQVAVARATELLILDVESGATTRFPASRAVTVSWYAGGAGLVAVLGDELVRITGGPRPVIAERRPWAEVRGVLADRRGLVTVTTEGIERAGQPTFTVPVPVSQTMLDLTRDDVPVIGVADGRVLLAQGAGPTWLRAPMPELLRLAASTDHIVGAGRGRIAIWNVSTSVPASLQVMAPAHMLPGAGSSVVTVAGDRIAWLDVARGTVRELEGPFGGAPFSASPSGDALLLLAQGGPEAGAYLATRTGPTLERLAGPIDAAAVTDTSILLARTGGLVEEHDRATKAMRTLVTGDVATKTLQSNGAWRGVGRVDGTYWRQHRLDPPQVTTLGAAAITELLADGTVIAAVEDRLVRWLPGHGPQVVARTGGVIVDFAVFPSHALGVLADRSIVRIDLDAGTVAAVDANGPLASVAIEQGLALAVGGREPRLIDVAANASWFAGLPPSLHGIFTTDARHVVAVTTDLGGGTWVRQWPLALPTDPFGLARWLDTITSARAVDDAGTLVWP